MRELREVVDFNPIVRTVSDGRDWYRVKYDVVELESGDTRSVRNEVSFVQAWDVDEALRVLKEVLKVEWQENEATIDGKYIDPVIVSVQKSDADCFINKVVEPTEKVAVPYDLKKAKK